MVDNHTMIVAVKFTSDGKRLLTESSAGCVVTWDVATQLGKPLLPEAVQGGLAFSQDGRFIAGIARSGGAIRIWDVLGAQKPVEIRRKGPPAVALAFSPDAKTLAVGTDEQRTEIWKLGAKTPCTVLKGGHHGRKPYEHGLRVLRFSPNGVLLATGGDDKSVYVWDLNTARRLATLKGHSEAVYDLAFSPGGEILASAGGEIRLWQIRRTGAIEKLGHFGQGFMCVQFSPDGKLLAAGGGGGSVTVWRFSHRRATQRIALKGHTEWRSGAVVALAFAPNGKLLASGGGDFLAPFSSENKNGDNKAWSDYFKRPGELKLWDLTTHADVTRPKGKAQFGR
jgi:WD40 repeat protein